MNRRSVPQRDYISLNVPGLLGAFANPSPQWRDKILALTGTELELLQKYALIKSSAPALQVALDQVVIRFSDYTQLGQEFVLSGAIDTWLKACDRKQTLAAYADRAPLEKRIVKFLNEKKAEQG